MTTIDTRPDADADAALGDGVGDSRAVSFFTTAAGWATSADHKRIGRLYAGLGLVILAATAVVGVLLGVERVDDGSAALGADAVLQVFHVYRVGLVFGAIAPLALGVSIAVAPLQVGARSIAFPRLALTGCYSWLGGLALTIAALIRNGGPGGGSRQGVDMFLAGTGLMVVGLAASAGCVATTVLAGRAPGMTMRRTPLFAWSALISALGVLLALPVVFGVVVYLFVDHRLAISANFGGTEGVIDWLGWVYSTPAIVVFAIPAVGVAAELVPVAFKQRAAMRGVAFAGIALVGVTALAATTQQFVHDLTFDTDGQTFLEGLFPFLIFAGLPLLGMLVVSGAAVSTAFGGLANGRPRVSAALVFAFVGFDLVFAGLIANFLIGITDLELIGTSIEEGAALLVVYGAALGAMGGLLFWAPKLWGRVVPDLKAMPLALVGGIGAVLAAVPLCIAGFAGLAGGVPGDPIHADAMLSLDGVDGGSVWAVLSLIGHALVVLAVVAFAGLLVNSFLNGDTEVDDNPSGGHTVEWGTTSPAPPYNYEHVATVASPEPRFDMTYEGSSS